MPLMPLLEEFMRKLFDEYNIDYIIHGMIPCLLPDGTDAYALAKKRQFSHGHSQKSEDGVAGSGTRVSHFLPTSRRIVQFSNSKVGGRSLKVLKGDGRGMDLCLRVGSSKETAVFKLTRMGLLKEMFRSPWMAGSDAPQANRGSSKSIHTGDQRPTRSSALANRKSVP
ncbi:hypothetical protein HAX54_052742 [Datura stramonium]|uniref:Uncharacterized protein n=1 Tax=Datura stramonium TaxID=4076 RepID=A0ABS8T193_DATST|nr:hypothetical protein [Datura stramonium]